MLESYFKETQLFDKERLGTFFKSFNPDYYQSDNIKKNKSNMYKSLRDKIRLAYFEHLNTKYNLKSNLIINEPFLSDIDEINNGVNTYDNKLKNKKNDLENIDGNSIRRVLIFRYDAIGDYIITSPLIRWLRNAKPDLQIDIVTSYRNDSIIKVDPLINNTFPIHPSKNYFLSWRHAIKQARQYDYDIIFGLVFTYMTKCALFAVGISPRSEKITIMHDSRKHIYGKVFNRQIFHTKWKEHWAKTMLRAGIESIDFNTSDDGSQTYPYIYFNNRDIESIYHHLKIYNLKYEINRENIIIPDNNDDIKFSGEPYCIINLSAYSPNRRLSESKCSAICKELLRRYPELMIFVTGSTNDKKNIQNIVDSIGSSRCQQLFMRLSEFIAFTSGASFIISPDTATVHIAAAAKVPVVGLFAELIKVAEWYPLNTKFAIALSPDPYSINAIDNNKIFEAVRIAYH